MLPENVELRRRHAPLGEFVARALQTPLLFPPGTKVSYQSMGVLLAAEVAQRITGQPFPRFLETEIFRPLGMTRTALGLGRLRISDTVLCQTEHAEPGYGGQADAASWDWNSPYWRNLAAPWGGAHSTARDIARFLGSFLRPSGKPLTTATATRMTQNQNAGLNQPWGIGWALERGFGKTCSSRTFGHSGSTGTLCWADPERDLIFVLLTSLPARVSSKTLIAPVSDLVSEAV
jgi:beta-lactamase class C